jgi:hypothetical protein
LEKTQSERGIEMSEKSEKWGSSEEERKHFVELINKSLASMKATFVILEKSAHHCASTSVKQLGYEEENRTCGCVSELLRDLGLNMHAIMNILENYGAIMQDMTDQVLTHDVRRQRAQEELIEKATQKAKEMLTKAYQPGPKVPQAGPGSEPKDMN